MFRIFYNNNIDDIFNYIGQNDYEINQAAGRNLNEPSKILSISKNNELIIVEKYKDSYKIRIIATNGKRDTLIAKAFLHSYVNFHQ